MIPSTERLKDAIERQGWTPNRLQVKLSVDPKGEHTETRWSKEFPRAIEWLFLKHPDTTCFGTFLALSPKTLLRF